MIISYIKMYGASGAAGQVVSIDDRRRAPGKPADARDCALAPSQIARYFFLGARRAEHAVNREVESSQDHAAGGKREHWFHPIP